MRRETALLSSKPPEPSLRAPTARIPHSPSTSIRYLSMRLLDVGTFELKSFPRKSDRPPYIIASHRWYDEELETSYEDVNEGKNSERASYVKVLEFCEYIRECHKDIRYLWIDTCCIDKKNAPELQEAITSMFAWYQEAYCCLAYLHDVATNDVSADDADFEQSEWFKRGWTLQELIAPPTVIFLNREWFALGYKGIMLSNAPKSLEDLTPAISTISTIPREVLHKYDACKNIDAVARLQWMNKRQTTKIEDMAYSLIGIFNISVSLRYGEGSKALERLEAKVAAQEFRKLHSASKADSIIQQVELLQRNLHDIFGVLRKTQRCQLLSLHQAMPIHFSQLRPNSPYDHPRQQHYLYDVGHDGDLSKTSPTSDSEGPANDESNSTSVLEVPPADPETEVMAEQEIHDSGCGAKGSLDVLGSRSPEVQRVSKTSYWQEGLRVVKLRDALTGVEVNLAVRPESSIIATELHDMGILVQGMLLPSSVVDFNGSRSTALLKDMDIGAIFQIPWPADGDEFPDKLSSPRLENSSEPASHVRFFVLVDSAPDQWTAAAITPTPGQLETSKVRSDGRYASVRMLDSTSESLQWREQELAFESAYYGALDNLPFRSSIDFQCLYTFTGKIRVHHVARNTSDAWTSGEYFREYLCKAWNVLQDFDPLASFPRPEWLCSECQGYGNSAKRKYQVEFDNRTVDLVGANVYFWYLQSEGTKRDKAIEATATRLMRSSPDVTLSELRSVVVDALLRLNDRNSDQCKVCLDSGVSELVKRDELEHRLRQRLLVNAMASAR